VVFAALLRLWIFPSSDELRDPDEIGYVTGGLVAWEGILPGWRSVPAGPQTWMGWVYVGARSAYELMSLARAHTAPTVLMPFMAVDRALFRTYEDLGGLRELMLWTSFLVSLCGVYGGYRIGARYGGATGGLLVGGLVATLPIYAEFTGISKSCSDAWMLGILAIACAATIQGTRRFWASGILLGLAIASRIDMVLVGPLILWMLWDNQNTEGLWKSALRLAVVSTVRAILAAPWAVLGFVGLLRTIGMARVVGYWTTESPRLTTLKDLA